MAAFLRAAHGQFRTAAADVNEQAERIGMFQPAGNAEVDQAGLFLSGNGGEGNTGFFPDAGKEGLTVGGIAHGGCRHGDGFRNAVCLAHGRHAFQDGKRARHAFLA